MLFWVIIVVGVIILSLFRFWPTNEIRLNINQSWLNPKSVQLVMAVIVSCAVLVSSLYIILSQQFDESSQKWAYGAIGTVIGFWFK